MFPNRRIAVSPRDEDVLFGRDADSWNHEGNKRFRALISRYQDEYHASTTRSGRVDIVAHIIRQVIVGGGRFLKRDKDTQEWHEVDRKACVEKVGHAIRDKQIIAKKSIERRLGYANNSLPGNLLRNIDSQKETEERGVSDASYSILNDPHQKELFKSIPADSDVRARGSLDLLTARLGGLQETASLPSPMQAMQQTGNRSMIRDMNAARQIILAEEMLVSLHKQRLIEEKLEVLRRSRAVSSLLNSTTREPTLALTSLSSLALPNGSPLGSFEQSVILTNNAASLRQLASSAHSAPGQIQDLLGALRGTLSRPYQPPPSF